MGVKIHRLSIRKSITTKITASNIAITFSLILFPQMWILSLKNDLVITFAGIKIRVRYIRCITGIKCRNVCEVGHIPSVAAFELSVPVNVHRD